MDNKVPLIENIKQSNLSKIDKKILIELLTKDDIDYNAFIIKFMTICKTGKEILKLFNIEIGDS
jgi:hypothetical protein